MFAHHGEKHLSPEDLAEREGVPLQTVYHWNKTGTGPRYMKIARAAATGWPTSWSGNGHGLSTAQQPGPPDHPDYPERGCPVTDARFPERWLNDRRILRLPDDAFRFFVLSLAWSVANRTDGYISDNDIVFIPGDAHPKWVQRLLDASLWDDCPGGWQIAEFEETQTTSAELAALDAARRKARDKKRRQRAAAARREAGDVPRDSTRTGQDRQL